MLPAREDSLPLPVVEDEDDDVCVGFRDDRESIGVVIKEFALVSSNEFEKDDEIKEGEVVRGDVSIVEVVNCPGIVVIVMDDVPVCGDDSMSQEHDSEGVLGDAVPDAQRSWNEGPRLIRDSCRRTDSELNLERPSMTNTVGRICRVTRVSGWTFCVEEADDFRAQLLLLVRRRRRRQTCKNPTNRAFYAHEARGERTYGNVIAQHMPSHVAG